MRWRRVKIKLCQDIVRYILVQFPIQFNLISMQYYQTSCPENKVFEVRDKNGNVIERANNSAGIYSVLQGIPSIQPSVTRFLQYEEKGKHVVLSCPGY